MLRSGQLRVYSPIVGLLTLFLALLLLAVFKTAGHANEVEAERSQSAVQSGFAAMAERAAGTVNDNANWDDAAVAFYRSRRSAAFAERTWLPSTGDHINFNEAHVVDATGVTRWSAVDGRAVAPRPLPPEVLGLSRTVDRRSMAAAGYVRRGTDLELVSLGLIVPTTAALATIIPDEGPHRLVLVRRVTPRVLADLARGLMLDDLRVEGRNSLRQNVAIAGPNGVAIADVSWLTRTPGNEALWRAAPTLAVALIVFLSICAMIFRAALTSVRELARQAVIDSLSQLPNRRALRRALRSARRDEPLALALLDLDGFKNVNDNYGHAVGDRLIRAVSDLLRANAGDEVLVARLGGDEFALLAQTRDAGAQIEAISHHLLDLLGKPFRFDERTIVIGASFGHATRGASERMAPTELLRRADVAMYAAKRTGRMRVVRFTPDLDAYQAVKRQIESELRIAIVEGAFTVVYQPLIAADRTTITGVEALLRWTSPTQGVVAPEVFVPIAEETGLIDRIGLFVLDRACRDALEWGSLRLAVNVSAAQLRNPDFPMHLGQVLRDTGFPPERLEVEITETYLVREAEAARKVLDGLRALGVTVSLDDFGTGFASIGFLRQFTFDKLKLDRSLVAEAEHSASARAMVQASVAVARALDMSVTAEGIETLGQADVMRIVGCDELQGWLFSRAASADEISALQATPEHRAPPRRAAR